MAPDPAHQVFEPGVNPARLETHRLVGTDPGAGGLTVAKADPGRTFAKSGPLEAGWRNPPAIGDEDRTSGEPIRVVDRSLRVSRALNCGQISADDHASASRAETDSEAPGELLAERTRAQEQVEDRSGERQRFEARDGVILDQAKSHRSLLVSRLRASR
jgi:hypothetical protein